MTECTFTDYFLQPLVLAYFLFKVYVFKVPKIVFKSTAFVLIFIFFIL